MAYNEGEGWQELEVVSASLFFFLEALCSDMYCVYWCHVGHLFTLVYHEGAYWYASVKIP